MSKSEAKKDGYTIVTEVEINGRRMRVAMAAGKDDLTIAVNGKLLGSFTPFRPPEVRPTIQVPSASDHRLAGPIAKLDRAKRHLLDLKEVIQNFSKPDAYEFSSSTDPKTRETVIYGRMLKPIPLEINAICGDVIHNLRSALDQLVCALVRANSKQVRNGNGFPIMGSKSSFQNACVSKLRNTTPKVQQFINRLKPYQEGNKLLWLLSQLDNMDKHNELVPVAIEHPKIAMQVGIPGLFVTPTGNLGIGGGPGGSIPMGFQHGLLTPKSVKPVTLGDDKRELMRMSVDWEYFPHNLNFVVDLSFGKSRVTNNEPIIQTLEQLAYLVERILNIVERRIL